jgi:hypothetical protein
MATYPLRSPVFVTTAAGEADTSPVRTIAGGYSAVSLAASGVASAAACTLVGLIVDDPGTNGTVKVWDNASAASGTGYGAPTKIATATNYIPYGIALANGCYVELGGSAKVTAIYKAD